MSEFEWQFLGLVAGLRITMPSSHTAFDAFLYSRMSLFDSLEATKESLDHLDNAIESDSALLSRSCLAEFASNITSLYMERAVNALDKYFQQFYQKVQSSRDSDKSTKQSVSLEAVLTCFDALLEFDIKRSSCLQDSLKKPPPRLLPRVLKPLRAYITALLPSALSALNTRITHDTWIDAQTARASDRLLPLLRRLELVSLSTPAEDILPPALSALVERALVEWLPLDELLSRLALPAAFGTLSAKVPASLIAQLERVVSNTNYGGRRALALLHSDASALGRSLSLLLTRRQLAAGDPFRALLIDLSTRCSRIARSTCERLLARESRGMVCTLFDARAFDWIESREFFEVCSLVLRCIYCIYTFKVFSKSIHFQYPPYLIHMSELGY